MDQSWQVRAVWVCRNGSTTERQFGFTDLGDAQRQIASMASEMGIVGPDDLALNALEIRGDFWARCGRPVRADRDWDEWLRPKP